eukprot:SAG11_NODE_1186_length_5590_cov_2.852850_3_plen_110_part_00
MSMARRSAEYIHSLRGYKNERFDGGASGAIMFFSADQRYIVKQMARSEAKKLQVRCATAQATLRRTPDQSRQNQAGMHARQWRCTRDATVLARLSLGQIYPEIGVALMV